jgi:hypothetical protein
MPRQEGQLAWSRIRLGIAQVVRAGIQRPAVAVDPQICDVEIEAREFEIVGVAAEERD